MICALIQAGGTAQSVLQLDLTQPEDTRSLARVVATLNERGDALETLAADARPWSELAALNDQADTVRKAASQGVFTPQETPQDEPIEPWRPFLARLKSLAPLVAIGQLMRIDLAEPEAFPAIADRLRQLRAVRLPDLAKPTAVLQIIDRASAIDRLTRSLGQNPVAYPIERVAAAVQARVAAAAAQLPPTLQASPGGTLLNAPRRAPNPSSLANPATVKAARRLDGHAPAVERAALRPVGPADARGAGAVAGRPTRARHGEGDAVRTRLRTPSWPCSALQRRRATELMQCRQRERVDHAVGRDQKARRAARAAEHHVEPVGLPVGGDLGSVQQAEQRPGPLLGRRRAGAADRGEGQPDLVAAARPGPRTRLG